MPVTLFLEIALVPVWPVCSQFNTRGRRHKETRDIASHGETFSQSIAFSSYGLINMNPTAKVIGFTPVDTGTRRKTFFVSTQSVSHSLSAGLTPGDKSERDKLVSGFNQKREQLMFVYGLELSNWFSRYRKHFVPNNKPQSDNSFIFYS